MIQQEILDIADKIQNGEDKEPLRYNWGDFYSWHFNRKPEYRLIYSRYKCLILNKEKSNLCQFADIIHTPTELKACDGLIEFVLVDTRENFNKLYKTSKSVIKKYRR